MGVIVHKDLDRRTELSDRISADLRERAKTADKAADPDLVEDSDYTKDLKKTGKSSWIWFLLIAGALLMLFLVILR